MSSKTQLFAYSDEDQTVYLASEIRPKFITGASCPAFSEISLEFLLTSDILGEANELLTIPIKPAEQTNEVVLDEREEAEANQSSFAGVNVAEVDAALAAQLEEKKE